MAQIIRLPVKASKLGFRRVRKGCHAAANPDQLDLFAAPTAEILEFSAPGIGAFAQALMSDERGDARAAQLYARAIEQQDCVADAFCNLGIIESGNGNTIKAFDCFTNCLKHNPRHAEAHYNLANLYFEQNDFRLAQLHFELAVEMDPEFANAWCNLALAQALTGDIAAALRTLARYRQLVTPEEARIAEELLENLRKSMSAASNHRAGPGQA